MQSLGSCRVTDIQRPPALYYILIYCGKMPLGITHSARAERLHGKTSERVVLEESKLEDLKL
jgi:hypothetical protein